jgi:3-oxoacyl-[acyl-carrier protein] reductase
MSADLDSRVVWITGTKTGIGRALALDFAERGAIVVATCIGGASESDGLEDDLKTRSTRSVVLEQDVTREDHAAAVADHISATFGRLDVLINNAGIYPRQPADIMTNQEWRDLLAINLDGAWYSCHAAIPLMKEAGYGKLIQVGSITTTVGMEHLTHYISSKMGVLGMTRGLARDLGMYGIRANCVVLGAVQVESEKAVGDPAEIEDIVNAHQCLNGRLTPDDVLPTFAFLASTDSDAITGQSITVDAGWIHTT